MASIRENRGMCVILGITWLLAIHGAECDFVGAPRSLVEETVFDVMQFGAKADGITDDATTFIKAWRAACDSPGAAKVLIPPGNYLLGEVLFAGPCAGNHLVVIEIQGNLSAVNDPSAFPNDGWITVERGENVEVTGGGTINAHGENYWQYASNENHLPVSFIVNKMGYCKVHNLNFVNSMGFHTKMTESHDIEVSNLTIIAPDESPNTDGIHLSNVTNLNITDSIIGTGDDCVSIGHGSVNIAITRVACGPGHGLSIGSLGKRPDEMNVQGITIKNCSLTNTTNGARIKTYHDSPSITASSIIFEDIVMDQVKNPIIIDQHYDSKKSPKQSSVKISDVHFRNIRGSTISKVPILLNCSSLVPCEGIELSNIDLVPVGEKGPLQSACSSAHLTITGILNPVGPALCI